MPIGKKQIALPITCFWGRVSNGFYFESFVCCIKKAQAGSPGFLVIKERFNVFLISRRLPAFLRCSLLALRCSLLTLRCSLLTLRCSLLALRCSLLALRCSLLALRCSLLALRCSLLALRCSLLALRCSLLALRCSLLALRCSLLTLRCGLLLDLPFYYFFLYYFLLHYSFLNNPLLRRCLLRRCFLSCSHTKPPTSLAQSEYKQVITNYQFYFMENCTCHASVLTACAQLYLCLNIASNTQRLEREHCAFHFFVSMFSLLNES